MRAKHRESGEGQGFPQIQTNQLTRDYLFIQQTLSTNSVPSTVLDTRNNKMKHILPALQELMV